MSKPVDVLRNKYKLPPHTVNNEPEWNELARLFVQRFQQIHGMPTDSLAGPRAFAILDGTAKCGYTIGNLTPCNRDKGHEGAHYSGATEKRE
jgi:hypothetical protein